MRSLWCVALFVGCGSPAAIEHSTPAPSREQVAEGGESSTSTPPSSETFRACTVERLSAGGNPLGWNRMIFDSTGRWRFKASGSDALPVTQSEYGYDSLGRLVSDPPATFAYADGKLLMGSEQYPLDEHDRVTERWMTGDGSATLYESYTYDDAGRIVHRDSEGRNRRYDYDELGFLAHETLLQPDGPGICRRTWVWTHGPIEQVSVQDDAGKVSQHCSYAFDDTDRLTSAKCSRASTTIQYDESAAHVSRMEGGLLVSVARFIGDCELPVRANLTRAFDFLVDPRTTHQPLARALLRTDLVPIPTFECTNGPGFD